MWYNPFVKHLCADDAFSIDGIYLNQTRVQLQLRYNVFQGDRLFRNMASKGMEYLTTPFQPKTRRQFTRTSAIRRKKWSKQCCWLAASCNHSHENQFLVTLCCGVPIFVLVPSSKRQTRERRISCKIGRLVLQSRQKGMQYQKIYKDFIFTIHENRVRLRSP